MEQLVGLRCELARWKQRAHSGISSLMIGLGVTGVQLGWLGNIARLLLPGRPPPSAPMVSVPSEGLVTWWCGVLAQGYRPRLQIGMAQAPGHEPGRPAKRRAWDSNPR